MKEKDNACVICCEHCGAPIGKHFYNEGWEAKQLATQRTVMEALWSITEYLEGALDKPPKCILRKYWDACTLDDFITAITEVGDE